MSIGFSSGPRDVREQGSQRNVRGKKTRNPGYEPGNHWVQCDRCAAAIRSEDARITWDNLIVCPDDWEIRHPQDFVRGRYDDIQAREPRRSESADVFVVSEAVIVPFTCPLSTVIPSISNPEISNTGFGVAAASSSDGTTISIGFRSSSDNGGVGIYTGSGGSYTEQDKLLGIASGGGVDNNPQEISTSLSASGDVVVIGQPDISETDTSAAGGISIYSRSGIIWTEDFTFINGLDNESFGQSVSLNAAGTLCAVGIPGFDDGFGGEGAVRIYQLNGSWAEDETFTASSPLFNRSFGSSVSLSSDGTILAIGERDASGNSPGTVYVYTRSGGTFSLSQTLTPSDGVNADRFGSAVSISPAGDYILIGAPSKDVSAESFAGAAYVFTGSPGSYSEEAILSETVQTFAEFGTSVRIVSGLTSPSIRAVIGQPFLAVPLESPADQVGEAYIYTSEGDGTWERTCDLRPGTTDFNTFGQSVFMSTDGSTTLVGDADFGSSTNGTAFAYSN